MKSRLPRMKGSARERIRTGERRNVRAYFKSRPIKKGERQYAKALIRHELAEDQSR